MKTFREFVGVNIRYSFYYLLCLFDLVLFYIVSPAKCFPNCAETPDIADLKLFITGVLGIIIVGILQFVKQLNKYPKLELWKKILIVPATIIITPVTLIALILLYQTLIQVQAGIAWILLSI